ncbi:MAG: hypothetical protein P1V20_26740, partial [Verrucomicrobiales bacterium]|nr:hypothetical protein [Verrucomicrobiales bacterium]
MPFAHFQVPAPGGPIQEALIHFLSCHQVLKIDRQFLSEGTSGFWLYCVQYAAKTGKATPSVRAETAENKPVDYKGIMGPADFSLLLKLKEWRNRRATAYRKKVHGIAEKRSKIIVAVASSRRKKRCPVEGDRFAAKNIDREWSVRLLRGEQQASMAFCSIGGWKPPLRKEKCLVCRRKKRCPVEGDCFAAKNIDREWRSVRLLRGEQQASMAFCS